MSDNVWVELEKKEHEWRGRCCCVYTGGGVRAKCEPCVQASWTRRMRELVESDGYKETDKSVRAQTASFLLTQERDEARRRVLMELLTLARASADRSTIDSPGFYSQEAARLAIEWNMNFTLPETP